jgi:hypothetical protein
VDRGGRRSFEGGDGVPVAGGQESSGEVARKLPRGDVVLVVSLAGAERRRSVGMTVRPTGGGARAHRRGGPPVLAWESEIGWAVSISGWRQCYWSTGSRVGDSRGG